MVGTELFLLRWPGFQSTDDDMDTITFPSVYVIGFESVYLWFMVTFFLVFQSQKPIFSGLV